MSAPGGQDRNQDNTVYVGNLDDRVTDALVWELMLQAGPVVNVHLPKDRISMTHQGYGFCEFLTEEDADYACKIMNQIKMFGKPIRVNKASSDRKQIDIGANLFVGNLDPIIDERMLFDTFMAFGALVQPAKISRDPTTGASKGYGFISFDSFEASDAAIESMNNQFLMNKPITVSYAFKKDGKGERHGTPAERLLAAQARKNNALPQQPPPPPPGMMSMMNQHQQQQQGVQPGMFIPPPPPPPMMLGGQGHGMPGMAPPQGFTQGYPPSSGGMAAPPPPPLAMSYPPTSNGMIAPPPPPPGFGGPFQPYNTQPYGQSIPPPPPPPGFA
ncbi:Spliceosome-associated protein 49 [Microbotryomycetes sp. JL221]|nr:Spliceosome-associated protein 49 [Microbotryomycetes sp. JL221]